MNFDLRRAFMCHLCSAITVADSKVAHEQFHLQYLNKEEVGTMSSAAWCDPGNHAFKAGEPGSQRFTGTSIDDDGNPVRMEMDACKAHSFQSPAKAIQDSSPSTHDDVTKPFGGTKG